MNSAIAPEDDAVTTDRMADPAQRPSDKGIINRERRGYAQA